MMRRVTKDVTVGTVGIGSTFPIAVQTMWSKPLRAPGSTSVYESVMSSLRSYATMGCALIRFSYPDSEDRELFTRICTDSPIPVVADIHFDWKLAI